MRIVLQVETGPQAGHKRFLGKGQVLEVGRSALVDLSIENDARMSGRHFRLVAAQDAAYVEDLNSSNGTLLGGKKVDRARLHDQDVIAAGNTRFSVRIEGTIPHAAAVTDTATAASSVSRTSKIARSATCTVEVCKSGVFQYAGSAAELSPAILAQRLATIYAPLLVLDMQRLSPEWSNALQGNEYLFDWLPEDTRGDVSPRILTATEQEAHPDVVDEAWGKDALICICAAPDTPDPMEQLRRCAGAYARPSLLRPQLSETVAEVAQNLMLGIEVVLVESETPATWLLYSLRDLEPFLDQLGLVKTESQEAT
jgi:hypothetical protein